MSLRLKSVNGWSYGLHIPVPAGKITFQFINGMPPFGRRGFTHRILVTEKAHLIDRFIFTTGFQPLHRNKILGLVRVVSIAAIQIAVPEHIHRQLFSVFAVNHKAADGFHRTLYQTNAHVPGRRNFYPDAIAGLMVSG